MTNASLIRYIPETVDSTDDSPLPSCISEETAKELYDRMVLLRTYDERSVTWHRHGRIGTYAIYWGHEAMQVGAVSALADEDWVLPSYRESAVGLMRGMSPTQVIAWWRGHPEGWWNPQEFKIASVSVPVGSHVTHAAGVAWGERLQGRNTAALAFFGDGATSEGDFHEGTNFAAVLELPVILLCNNNQWAITTPLSKQTKARTLADKAIGYGIPAVRVDGNDILAVYEAVHQAVEHGKEHGEPTFIECVSYRAALHATADDVNSYRDDEEAKLWRDNNCLARYEAYLIRQAIIDEEYAQAKKDETRKLMNRSIEEAEALPDAAVEEVFDHVYAQRLPAYERDLAEIARVKAGN